MFSQQKPRVLAERGLAGIMLVMRCELLTRRVLREERRGSLASTAIRESLNVNVRSFSIL